MTGRKILIICAGILISTTALHSQDGRVYRDALQVWFQRDFGQAGDGGFGNQVIRSKPFSAAEERHFLQILADGTRIETNEVNRIYRDSQGRTRTEEMDGKASVVDPVAGFRAELDPATRTVRTVKFPGALPNLPLGIYRLSQRLNLGSTQGVTSQTVENLKPQVVNGVMAQGTRTTMTIPRGEIGNDRDIKVVTERWTSNDLQMLVKSTNSDPRFGDTTYQLTGIVEQEPDAALFRIPDGYTEAGGGRSGGRGPAAPGAAGRGGSPTGRGGRGSDK